jgi:hypothetical protein
MFDSGILAMAQTVVLAALIFTLIESEPPIYAQKG